MGKISFAVAVLGIFVFISPAHAKKEANKNGNYNCLEVEKFQVDRDNMSTKELERAAAIPEEELTNLQHSIVGEATRQQLFPKVVKSEKSACPKEGLIFGGKVTDYKQGNRAARILIGLGAGKQKFQVDAYLKDKATGNVVATKEIIDRKVGGWAGGDEAKGRSDFAEKVVKFIQEGK